MTQGCEAGDLLTAPGTVDGQAYAVLCGPVCEPQPEHLTDGAPRPGEHTCVRSRSHGPLGPRCEPVCAQQRLHFFFCYKFLMLSDLVTKIVVNVNLRLGARSTMSVSCVAGTRWGGVEDVVRMDSVNDGGRPGTWVCAWSCLAVAQHQVEPSGGCGGDGGQWGAGKGHVRCPESLAGCGLRLFVRGSGSL